MAEKENTLKQTNSRREFIKNASIGGAAIAITGAALSGCSSDVEQEAVVQGKSKKVEVLYRGDTKQWQQYFAVAK